MLWLLALLAVAASGSKSRGPARVIFGDEGAEPAAPSDGPIGQNLPSWQPAGTFANDDSGQLVVTGWGPRGQGGQNQWYVVTRGARVPDGVHERTYTPSGNTLAWREHQGGTKVERKKLRWVKVPGCKGARTRCFANPAGNAHDCEMWNKRLCK